MSAAAGTSKSAKHRRKFRYPCLIAAGCMLLLLGAIPLMRLPLSVSPTFAEGVSFLAAAVEVNPQNSERLLTLLASELQLGKVDEARTTVARMGQRFPHDAKLAYEAGELLLQYNLTDEAETQFKRTSILLSKRGNELPSGDLNLSDVELQMARLQFDRNDYWSALRYFDKIELEQVATSLQPSALHLEGQALVAVGRAREALERLSEAARMNPYNPEFLVHLAWAETLAGHLKSADSVMELAASKWPDVPDVKLILTLLKREDLVRGGQVPYFQEWHLKGEGLVCCPCKMPCPCRSNAPPTYGHCENAAFTHIVQGHYGRVSLSGLSFVTVYTTMNPRGPSSMFYISRAAAPTQVIALQRLVQSFNPLYPSFPNIERSSISYSRSPDGRTYDVRVPHVLHLRIRRQVDGNGQPSSRTAALDDFSNVIEYAQNLIFKIWDQDGRLKLDYSGRQADFRVIDLDYEDYKNGKILKQFADGSGYFNRKELALIRDLKLPTLASYPR
jgi:hypothetical protein